MMTKDEDLGVIGSPEAKGRARILMQFMLHVIIKFPPHVRVWTIEELRFEIKLTPEFSGQVEPPSFGTAPILS